MPRPSVLLVCSQLHRLAASYMRHERPDQARVAELRTFGGLTVEETAEVLGISPPTVKRGWRVARRWL
ncbi:MAG TPA: ECF-type sigma factor [Terriglobia bacterium]|nr:ECF-type sigma factor [Terriglobia bacterium]